MIVLKLLVLIALVFWLGYRYGSSEYVCKDCHRVRRVSR